MKILKWDILRNRNFYLLHFIYILLLIFLYFRLRFWMQDFYLWVFSL